jgi:hypothetical protein
MALTPEQREQIDQIRKFAAILNLSDDQKQRLRALLERANEKARTHQTANSNAPNADLVRAVASNSDQIRQQIVNFLTPEQLTKWNNAAKSAKKFVVEKSAA